MFTSRRTERKIELDSGVRLFALALIAFVASSQEANSAPVSLSATPAQTTIARSNTAVGTPRWLLVGSDEARRHTRSTLQQSAAAFLSANAALFGLDAPEKELVLVRTDRDPYGADHLLYRQQYRGIPVFAADLRVHTDASGRLRAVTGLTVPHIDIDVVPELSPSDAETRAAVAVAKSRGAFLPALRTQSLGLVIFREGLVFGIPGENRLAYRVDVSRGQTLREEVFVDADSGVVLASYGRIHDALSRQLSEENLSNVIWTEGDLFPGALDSWQQNEIIGSGHSYNFFLNAFGFVSYDNNDAQMRTVNNSTQVNCPNATWNGQTTNYCDGTATDDIITHEWGHAYTDYTSDAIYAWQAGAINESYSDIWGETVDLLNGYEDDGENLSARTGCGSSDRWMMGEDATAFGGAIRDMWDPTCKNDPGKVTDSQYVCSTFDNGGVHINSGIPNKAYALLVDGGTYNGQTINPLGFTKAAHLHWRAISVYETRTTDFYGHADALEASCADLIGIDLQGLSVTDVPAGPSGEILTLADCQELAKAIAAVEFRTAPCPGVFDPLLDPNTPASCNGQPLTSIHVQDFEAGLGSWTVGQVPSNPATWDSRDWTLDASLPHGRAGTGVYGPDPAIGNCSSDLDNGVIYLQSPPINIPPSSPAAVRLNFDHWVSMENRWDGGSVRYSTDGVNFSLIPSNAFLYNAYNTTLYESGQGNDNPRAGEAAFTGADGGSVSGSWGQSQINLRALGINPGDTIHLRWEVSADGCNGWDGWYVDDINVYACEFAATTTSTSSTTSTSTTSTTLNPGNCPAQPMNGCRTAWLPNGAGASSIALLHATTLGEKDKLKWKWKKGLATSLSEFLDPVSSPNSEYHICMYDSASQSPRFINSTVRAMGTCNGSPCWKETGSKGFLYKDKSASSDGITVIKLRRGVNGKASVKVAGKGTGLSMFLMLESPVTAQFLATDGTTQCWETVFSNPTLSGWRSYKATGP